MGKPVKKFIRILLATILLWGTATYANTLKIATEATYPPFEYVDPNGQMQGFDVDVMKAMCLQMKVKCHFVNQPWDSLIPSLKMGKFDVLMGAIAITSPREKQVSFTNPYYQSSVSMVASKNAHLSLKKQSLKGKKIGVQGGTTFDIYLQEMYGPLITISRYPSEENALLDLQSGRIDAVVGDTPLIQQWLKNHGGKLYHIVGHPITDVKYFGKGDGFAVKKDNLALLSKLNKALSEIKSNGAYAAIVKHYFGKQN